MKPLFIAVQQLEDHIASEIEGLLENAGLSAIEACVLNSLFQQDGQLASHLAISVGRAATSFTPILDRLEKKGLIERRAHPDDRRAITIHRTKTGKQVCLEANEAILRVDSQMRGQLYDWLPVSS